MVVIGYNFVVPGCWNIKDRLLKSKNVSAADAAAVTRLGLI